MKKIFALILTLTVASGLLAGCKMVEVDTQAEGKRVIATVNGNKILKEKFTEQYQQALSYYSQNYGDPTSSQAQSTLETWKTQIMDTLVQEEVVRQHAEKEGYLNYTEEQKAKANAEVDKERQDAIESNISSLKTTLKGQKLNKNAGESDDDYYARVAAQQVDKQIKDSGKTINDLYADQVLKNALRRYQDDKMASIVADEGSIATKYETLVNSQKESYATKSAFVSAYQQGTDIATCYYPEGYSLVQNLLISFSDEDKNNISTLQKVVDDLNTKKAESEASLSTETDETKKAELNAAINDAKAKLPDAEAKVKTARTKAEDSIRKSAEEILASVKGTDEAGFIKVLLEKGTDTGMKTEEAAKKGYLIGEGDGMVTEFHTAALALKNAGEISGLVGTQYGFHIIRKIKDLPAGQVPLEDVRTKIEESMTTEAREAKWKEQTTAWVTEAKVVKYTDRLAD